MKLKVRRTFEAQTKTKPLIDSAGRSEAVPYIRPLKGYVHVGGGVLTPRLIQMAFPFIAGRSAARVQPSQSPAVTAPPKGEPRHAHARIGATLPLPSGEVAAA